MLSEFHVPRTICESVPAGHTHGNTNQGGQGASAIISSLTVFGPTLVRSHLSYLRLLDTVRVFASSHGCCPPTLSRGNAVWKRIFLTWYRKMYPRLFNTVSMHQLWNSAFLTTDPEKMVVMANSKPNHFGLAHWTKMPQWTDIIGVKSTVRQTAIFFVSDERNE